MPSRNCPELTAEMVRELLEYDPTTGLLTGRLVAKKSRKVVLLARFVGTVESFTSKLGLAASIARIVSFG